MTYHISPKTGKPNRCTATKRACPVGGAHYDTREEAQAAFEQGKDAVAKGLKKKAAAKPVSEKYGDHDNAVLPGMEIEGEDLAQAQDRVASKPVLDVQDIMVDGQPVSMVTANGEPLVPSRDRTDLETVHRVVNAGQWQQVRPMLYDNESAVADLTFYLTWEKKDLAEEIDAYEESEALTANHTARERDAYEQTLELHRAALAIREAEDGVKA